eukprot:Gregarina_sp_Poly_1__551@NODE_1131_length_4993_cov_135_826431_g78_i1_p3_GENE_NODE_1131_length_4993_cov_135_826431_g78_i1NODE_1131_length_4993_cov_135_826431_g78_i1_p3_ORF_typecomplete_len380_score26_58_NODE_1131_length_4993_cov_135_826431_g78_i135894728
MSLPELPAALYGAIYAFSNQPVEAIQEIRCLNHAFNRLTNDADFWIGCAATLRQEYHDPRKLSWTSSIPEWYQHLVTTRMRAFGRGVSGRCCSCTPFTRLRLQDIAIGKRLIRTGLLEVEISTQLEAFDADDKPPSAVAIEVQFRDASGELTGSLYRDFRDLTTWPDCLIARSPVPLGTSLIELHFNPHTPHHFAKNTCIQLMLNLVTMERRSDGRHSLPLMVNPPCGSRHAQNGMLELAFGSDGQTQVTYMELFPAKTPPRLGYKTGRDSPMVELRLRCQTEQESNMVLVMSEGPSQWSWSSTRNSSSDSRLTVCGGIALAISDPSFRQPLSLRVSVLSKNKACLPSTFNLFVDKAVLTWSDNGDDHLRSSTNAAAPH